MACSSGCRPNCCAWWQRAYRHQQLHNCMHPQISSRAIEFAAQLWRSAKRCCTCCRFVKVTLGPNTKKTRTIYRNTHPLFEQQ
jgi:hypothetical protein